MCCAPDPFLHHPGLRGLIVEPAQSQWRCFNVAGLIPKLKVRGIPTEWFRGAEEREADRRETLAKRPEGPLWVFGYGSLMWDPGVHFAEVRRGFAPGHERRMILKDIWGGRGDVDQPGVMAALDDGQGCHGLAFRIEDELIEAETPLIFDRERAGPAYIPAYIPVETDLGRITALTFVADHSSEAIAGEMSRDEIIGYMARGQGFLGSSLDYGRNMLTHFRAMKIEDPGLEALVADAEALQASEVAR